MQTIINLFIGITIGFVLGGRMGVLIGWVAGLLISIVGQLDTIIKKLDSSRTDTEKTKS